MLRRLIWYDRYTEETMPAQFRNRTYAYIRTHIDHCVESLRVELMCQSDVSLYLAEHKRDADGTERWEADFTTLHKCRNYEQIREAYIDRIHSQGRFGRPSP